MRSEGGRNLLWSKCRNKSFPHSFRISVNLTGFRPAYAFPISADILRNIPITSLSNSACIIWGVIDPAILRDINPIGAGGFSHHFGRVEFIPKELIE
jgi:hypothetical protein